jgi:hypothetical protein
MDGDFIKIVKVPPLWEEVDERAYFLYLNPSSANNKPGYLFTSFRYSFNHIKEHDI